MSGTVYFLKSGDSVKVGYTTNLDRRLRSLMTGNPGELEILGSVAGSKYLERAIHSHVQHLRQRGEWFADCQELRGLLYSLMEVGTAAIGFVEPPPAEAKVESIPQPIRAPIEPSNNSDWSLAFARFGGILSEVEAWGLQTPGKTEEHVKALRALHNAIDRIGELMEIAFALRGQAAVEAIKESHRLMDELGACIREIKAGVLDV